MTKIGILGSGDVGKVLAAGFAKHGHEVMIGSRTPSKLKEFAASNKIQTGTFEETATFGETLVLAATGYAASDCLRACGVENLKDKVIIDATNPAKKDATFPPPGGVIEFFKPERHNSLMEFLQAEFPDAKFVKGFSCVGNAFMIDPDFGDGPKPTIFICGNDEQAKVHATELIEGVGNQVEDFGPAAVAGAIESLCQLWLARGFNKGKWAHAFTLLKKD